jgi:hypothetical protein
MFEFKESCGTKDVEHMQQAYFIITHLKENPK